ncbi:MAG: small multi-drug export protein [Parasporobacterium sp.]|nr:small multi-drug export protein [Parasporobacterium sp.]
MDKAVTWITTLLAGWNPNIIIFVISLLPILELRGGLLAATFLGVPYWQALIICVIGNIIPIPFILLFIKKIFEWLKKFKLTGRFVNWLERKTLKKRATIDKFGFWGLILFVGIPLPGTGGWTGALLASLLGIPIKRSSVAIGIGIILAAIIMSLISYVFIPLIANGVAG